MSNNTNNTNAVTVVNSRGEQLPRKELFWFSFRRSGRVTEVCVKHHDWALARRKVKEAYGLRDEEIETL
jgi:hypothetical protein